MIDYAFQHYRIKRTNQLVTKLQHEGRHYVKRSDILGRDVAALQVEHEAAIIRQLSTALKVPNYGGG